MTFQLGFVDEVKYNVYGNPNNKSRLVSQNFKDAGAKNLFIRAPTISRIGERVGFSLIAMKSKCNAFSKDVRQAYTQSAYEIERNIYLEPIPEMELPGNKVLKAKKPLYGIPEAGLFWF